MEGSRVEISVIIVSHNRREILRECLISLRAGLAGIVSEVIVVDNASREDVAGMVGADFPEVRLSRNRVNLGFARANNQGLSEARGRYLMLLNPDTVVPPGAVRELVSYLEKHPEAGAVGPRLCFADGSFQPSTFGFPSVLREAANLMNLDRFFPRGGRVGTGLARALGRRFPDFFPMYLDGDSSRKAPALFGACILFRREVRERIGDLDPDYFLYWEDADFCRRMQEQGFEVHYHPGAEVKHLGGADYYLPAEPGFFFYYQSLLRFFSKHYSRRRLAALRRTVVALVTLRLVGAGLRRRLGGGGAESETRNLRAVRDLYRGCDPGRQPGPGD